jgi:D-alanyl-D-alanine carboxypeptidase
VGALKRVMVLFLLTPAIAGAADAWAPAGRLDAWLDTLAQGQLASGSLAISERGVVRYRRSVGFARIDNGTPQPTDPGTRYHIGAVTRLFTAVLTMQLVERASVTLDSPVAEFFPDLPDALHITYEHLLRQRSGLADYTAAKDYPALRTAPHSRADMLRSITAGGTRFPVGERVEPNDSNYLLLGYVLEQVYERSYADIERSQITDRLGLARTYFAGTGLASLEASAFRWTSAGWTAEPASDPSVQGGALGMVSNAADLVVFMDALFTGKLLTSHSLESMRDLSGGSGIGLWPERVAGIEGLGERGNEDSFSACVYYFPEQGITFAWTGNAMRVPLDTIVEQAMNIVLHPAYRPARVTPAE